MADIDNDGSLGEDLSNRLSQYLPSKLMDRVQNVIAELRQPKAGAVPVRAWVATMTTSGGTNYYVAVGFPGGSYITPQMYDIKGRAEFDVAEWNHLFGHCEKPNILAFDTESAPQAQPVEQHADDKAVDAFAEAMKAKMAAARAKGRGGWDDPAQCSGSDLSRMLREHVEKGDPRDVGNFCMMLHQRGEAIEPRPAEQQGQAVADIQVRQFSPRRGLWTDWERVLPEYYERNKDKIGLIEWRFLYDRPQPAAVDAVRAQKTCPGCKGEGGHQYVDVDGRHGADVCDDCEGSGVVLSDAEVGARMVELFAQASNSELILELLGLEVTDSHRSLSWHINREKEKARG